MAVPIACNLLVMVLLLPLTQRQPSHRRPLFQSTLGIQQRTTGHGKMRGRQIVIDSSVRDIARQGVPISRSLYVCKVELYDINTGWYETPQPINISLSRSDESSKEDFFPVSIGYFFYADGDGQRFDVISSAIPSYFPLPVSVTRFRLTFLISQGGLQNLNFPVTIANPLPVSLPFNPLPVSFAANSEDIPWDYVDYTPTVSSTIDLKGYGAGDGVWINIIATSASFYSMILVCNTANANTYIRKMEFFSQPYDGAQWFQFEAWDSPGTPSRKLAFISSVTNATVFHASSSSTNPVVIPIEGQFPRTNRFPWNGDSILYVQATNAYARVRIYL